MAKLDKPIDEYWAEYEIQMPDGHWTTVGQLLSEAETRGKIDVLMAVKLRPEPFTDRDEADRYIVIQLEDLNNKLASLTHNTEEPE